MREYRNRILTASLNEEPVSKSEDEITAEIPEYIANVYEFDEETDEYEDYADWLLTDLCDTYQPFMRELDYKRTGNILFLWEIISESLTRNKPLPELTRKYLTKAGNNLTSGDYPSDPTRYMLICDDLLITGKRPPFAEYLKEKQAKKYLALYYWIMLTKYIQNGVPETEAGKNKVRKSSRIEAASHYKQSELYNQRTYYNWVQTVYFTHLDFLCLYERNYRSLTSTEKVLPQTNEITSLSEALLVDLFENPTCYIEIFELL